MAPADILVVDDQAPNRELVRLTLEGEGHRVRLAASGTEAVERWTQHPPDLVLLDVCMPDMSGFDVCERMRLLPVGAQTPVLFLTALREVDTFEQALRAGAIDFLTKPIKPAELLLRVAAALKQHHLRSERDELYELLRRQRDDLMRAVLHKERLTAFLVHDLKNPVSGMQLATQIILADPAAPPRTRDAAERIAQEARKLQRMILDLLDISKADEGKLEPSRDLVDLTALVSEVFSALKLRAESRGLTLQTSLQTPSARADRELLRRILENLVENAIRHAPRATVISVGSAPADAGILLRIADAGSGVPEPLRASIFERYVQAKDESRAGQGLGLAFCKLAIEAHGGRIWVEDAPSGGAVFCLWLPS